MIKTLGALAAGAILAMSAQAATIVFEDPVGIPPLTSLQPTEFTQNMTLGFFNTTLGTLNSVTLELFGAANTTITLTNNAVQSQFVSATGSVDLIWSSTNAGIGALLGSPPQMSMTMPTGLQNIAGGGGVFVSPLLTATDFDILNPANLALFSQAGGGNFSLTCQSLSGLAVTGGGGQVATNQTTNGGCGAQVTYDYTPTPPTQGVPEPGSMALVGLALAGLGLVRRRKA